MTIASSHNMQLNSCPLSHQNLLQNLTNCECKTFIGSVAEMKGNEARVVLFLHPVDQLKDGQLLEAKKTSWSSFIVGSLLVLGFLLGLGVLLYLYLFPYLLTIQGEWISIKYLQELSSSTEVSVNATMESEVTPLEIDTTEETEGRTNHVLTTSPETTAPGIIPCHLTK